MDNLIKKIFIVILASGIVCTSTKIANALDDAIIAVVNDEVITLSDLRDYIRTTYVSLVADGMPDSDLRQIMADLEVNGINKLVEDKLLLTRANQIGLEIRDKLIDDRIEKIKSRYPSELEFTEALVQHGASVTDLRKKIENQVKIRYLIEHEIRSKIYVNPQEITKYYEENIHSFQKKEKVFLESIYIGYGDDMEVAFKKANEALDLIKEGQDFLEVAKKYSEAPSIGSVERGSLVPIIEKTVFHLNQGEPSAPIEIDTGVYIFLLTGREPAKLAELSEVNEAIRDLLFQKKFKKQYLAWLEQLKKDAYVEIKK